MAHVERERRIEVAEALRELVALVNSQRNVEVVLDFVLQRAVDLLASDAGLIYLSDPDQNPDFLYVAAVGGLSPERVAPRIRIGSPVSGLAFKERRAVAFHDLRHVLQDESGDDGEPLLEDWNSHLVVRRIGRLLSEPSTAQSLERLSRTHPAALAVPLVAREEIYGTLALFRTEAGEFSPEVVELASAFANQAALVIENARLHRRAEQRAEELQMLYGADELLHQSLRLNDVLQALCDIAATTLRADKTVAFVWDEARRRVVVGGGHALSAPFRAISIPAEDIAGVASAYSTSDIIMVEDVATDPRMSPGERERDAREGVRAWLSSIIHTGDQVFGSLLAGYAVPRSFNEQERRVVRALAQRAALAIQNARLYEQSQQAATLEERQRLARELHDSVTQALYAISIYTETAGRALADSNVEAATINLGHATEATREALAEMRLLIYELRPPLLEEFGLAAALRARLRTVETRAGLSADLETDGDERLAPEVEQELYRMAQEALNNVLKHAHAQRLSVRLRVNSDVTALEIADDGIGFEPELDGRGGLGLPGMRERAARLHGTVKIVSAVGSGTRVQIQIPR
ncbi:MAG: GAF domain-containing sensor histidine kinase [Chloroflexi bacterium]|nr:GAF domain-containing sensor histidine kinase [Chloroflexota bacterium]MBV9894251.1 GAF domain-containing sensor histidine kinase [Chloroflexota bacterium]